MSSSKGVSEYIERYKQYEVDQLRAMISQHASPEAVELSAQPWKVTRETLEDVNNRTERALDRLMAGWSGDAADEFRSRVELLGKFTNELSSYMRRIETVVIPDLSRHLKEAQDSASDAGDDASEMSYEEWAESRESHEMNDKAHYENAQQQDRERMAQIVGTLAAYYAEMSESFKSNPPPTPAVGTPGEFADPPTGSVFDQTAMQANADEGQAPPAPAVPSTSASGSSGITDTLDDPATPATENPWSLGDADGEEVGEGLYAGTGGAGLGGGVASASGAAPAGGAGVGAMGAGAAGLGVAGAGAAAASGGGGAARPGSANAASMRPGGSGAGRPGMGGPAVQTMAGGGKPGSAGAKGGMAGGRPGAPGMAGGRPADDSEEESTKDSNWLKESERYFSHFDPNAGPSDEYDPKSVREWERMYDRWKELKESGEL